ncbi:MAG TPA: N-acetyltransferase [Terriglobia bacterium]|nr:N-acetyltransferase [Terriglobia bacterium]
MLTPTLRAFRASDLDALYQLDQVCFEPGVAYSRAELAAYIRRPDTETWVAQAGAGTGRELAGFVVASCDRRGHGHIITLDVAPAWRRRALGSLLMDAAENWVLRQGGEGIYLEAAEANLGAQAFYLRRGYQKARRVEDYYGAGAAAWLMAKQLRPTAATDH